MTASYASHVSPRQTPQSEPIPGKEQVQNSAGGYVFQLDDWKRLDRFLILGCEGGTYYADERELTKETAQVVLRCWDADAQRTVNRIVEISEAGRAPKNDAAIFALALCAGLKPGVNNYALDAMPRVCRTGTMFFQFVQAVREFRGMGRALRRGLAKWYTHQESNDQLAYQLVKYQSRNGLSHRDVLRLVRPRGYNNPALRWATGAGLCERTVQRLNVTDPTKLVAPIPRATHYPRIDAPMPAIIDAFERAKRTESSDVIITLIHEHNLPRECIPTHFLNDARVWEALLEKMPMTAMIRNLAKMTNVGLLSPMSRGVAKIVAELANVQGLQKSRIHPVAILAALLTYRQGHGERGKLKWSPVPQIIDALDTAFYAAFGNVESTGKRWFLGCDVSGSMGGGTIAGVPGLTPCVGVGALALITAAREPLHYVCGFCDRLVDIPISPRQRLDDVAQMMQRSNFGRTDCALPMIAAAQARMPVDVFVVLTDNETWFGNIHPVQALQNYRQRMGLPAKLIVVGMTSTGFSIADPNDFSMLDVVGFDTAAPQLMVDFAKDA